MDILFAPPDRVRDLQEHNLRTTLPLLRAGHPYVRALGVDVDRIDDLAQLPVVDKDTFTAAPNDFVLDLPSLPMAERTVHDILYTTGTTSAPTPFVNTCHDSFACLAIARRVVEIVGVTAADVIANLYPLGPLPHLTHFACTAYAMVSGARMTSALTGAGYPAFPVTRSLELAVEQVERSRATLLWGMPSFVRRLLRSAQRCGADFSSVRVAAVSGEPTSATLRADLVERLQDLGATSPGVNNRFGFTEMASVMVECSRDGAEGFHMVAPDHFLIEAVDGEDRPVPDGEVGRLVITHLQRRGTVLLRYAPGDLVTLTHEPCPGCGRTCPRVTSQPLRAGDRLLIKGTLVDPRAALAELAAVAELIEHQLVVTRVDPDDPLSMDHLVVRIATAADNAALRRRVADVVQQATEVRPAVELVNADALYHPDRDTKPRRVVDLR